MLRGLALRRGAVAAYRVGKRILTMDRLDMSDGTIRHMYIPDFLASAEPLP